jgi:hypothetical protein
VRYAKGNGGPRWRDSSGVNYYTIVIHVHVYGLGRHRGRFLPITPAQRESTAAHTFPRWSDSVGGLS